MCEQRELEVMPFDKRFDTSNGSELCHATGIEVLVDGVWLNEHEDSLGELHYGV